MEKGFSRETNMLMKFMDENTSRSIDNFVTEYKDKEYMEISDDHMMRDLFKIENLNDSEIEKLRYYTGLSYKKINSLLRNKWNYEENGILTDEKRKEVSLLSNEMDLIISKTKELPISIKTFRGTNISQFYDYGITSFEELSMLNGKFFYDSAFTSTSFKRNKSFFNRDLEDHEKCNIEIEYLIPSNSNDGVALLTDDLSYSKDQAEFLLNKGNLSKILDVKVVNDIAYIKMLLIPKKVWNLKEDMHNEKQSIKK